MSNTLIFAGLEAGVGKAICAANIAVRLSQRWRCLAIDLDTRSGNLHNYLGVLPAGQRIWERPDDPFDSLRSLKITTRFANLDFIDWNLCGDKPVTTGFPPAHALLKALQHDPADFVLATLTPGAGGEALNLFAAADAPILVIRPDAAMDKAIDFFSHLSRRGFGPRRMQVIVNESQPATDKPEMKTLFETARDRFGLNVTALGAVAFDPDALTNTLRSAPGSVPRAKSHADLAFEEMVLKIESLLPGSPDDEIIGVPDPQQAEIEHLRDEIHRIEEVNRALAEENAALRQGTRPQAAKSESRLETLLRQRRSLAETLRRQPTHSVTIILIVESGKDGFDFAIELQAILETAGWRAGFTTSPFEENPFYGLHILTDGSDIAASAGRILADAFTKSSLDITQTTAAAPDGVDPVRLVVGSLRRSAVRA